MPLAAVWMDLEMVIVDDKSDRGRQIPCDTTYMWDLKQKDANEFVSKTERYTQIYIDQTQLLKGNSWGEG